MIHKSKTCYPVSRFAIPSIETGLVGIHEVNSFDFTTLFSRAIEIESGILKPIFEPNSSSKQLLMRIVRRPEIEPN